MASLRFSVGQLPDLFFSFAVGRNSLRLCRACRSCGIHGVGSGSHKPSARERRMERTELLRRNRRDPQLERAARTRSRKSFKLITIWCFSWQVWEWIFAPSLQWVFLWVRCRGSGSPTGDWTSCKQQVSTSISSRTSMAGSSVPMGSWRWCMGRRQFIEGPS